MMYDSFLQRLHQKIGTFILLPSSIHEVIVYPFDKNSMSFYEYQQMVMEINQTCVLEEEVLADSVYLYDGNQILLVSEENGVYYNEAMRQGHDLEDYVARRFMEETGKKVRRANVIYKSTENPFMFANVDRL